MPIPSREERASRSQTLGLDDKDDSNVIRVVPSLLAKGGNIVKGRLASNDRVVGTLDSALRVQSSRNVDEVLLINVASVDERGSSTLLGYTNRASKFLRVPFTVGGGVRRVEEIGELLNFGADKVLLGRKALASESLLTEAAALYGSQAVTTCIEIEESDVGWRISNLPEGYPENLADYSRRLEAEGTGEIALFCKSRDGTRDGVLVEPVETLVRSVSVPIAYLGGVSGVEDSIRLADAGVNAIVIGALFAFSRFTPNDIKRGLAQQGYEVRLAG